MDDLLTVERDGVRTTGRRCLPWSDTSFKPHCGNVGVYSLGGTPVCEDHFESFVKGQLSTGCDSSMGPAKVVTERIPFGEPGAKTWADNEPVCDSDPRLSGATVVQAALIKPGDTAYFSYNANGEMRCAWILVNEVKAVADSSVAFYGVVADEPDLWRSAEYPAYSPVVVVPFRSEDEPAPRAFECRFAYPEGLRCYCTSFTVYNANQFACTSCGTLYKGAL